MNESDKSVTKSTRELILQFERANNRVASAQQTLEQAKIIQEQAVKALGEWIVPKDGEYNENFNIWYGSSLLKVTIRVGVLEGKLYEITWRTRDERDFH